MTPIIYADFHNADEKGRIRLNCTGTVQDQSAQQVRLEPGLTLNFYSDDADDDGNPDDLRVTGVVEYSAEEHCWVATIDWSAIRHVSDDARHLAARDDRIASGSRPRP